MNNSKRSKNMKTIASKLENTNKVHFEGQLYKFTNVVKGWQFRWFVLRPEFGRLDYYLVEERGVTNLIGVSNETVFSKPRGSGKFTIGIFNIYNLLYIFDPLSLVDSDHYIYLLSECPSQLF